MMQIHSKFFLAGVFVMEEGGCDLFRNEGIRCVIISGSTILQDHDVSSCTTVVTNSHDMMPSKQHSFRIFTRSAPIVASDRSRNREGDSRINSFVLRIPVSL